MCPNVSLNVFVEGIIIISQVVEASGPNTLALQQLPSWIGKKGILALSLYTAAVLLHGVAVLDSTGTTCGAAVGVTSVIVS